MNVHYCNSSELSAELAGDAVYHKDPAELLRVSQVAAGSTHQYFTFFVVGGALYLLMTSISNRVFNHAEARVGRSFKRNFARN